MGHFLQSSSADGFSRHMTRCSLRQKQQGNGFWRLRSSAATGGRLQGGLRQTGHKPAMLLETASVPQTGQAGHATVLAQLWGLIGGAAGR